MGPIRPVKLQISQRIRATMQKYFQYIDIFCHTQCFCKGNEKTLMTQLNRLAPAFAVHICVEGTFSHGAAIYILDIVHVMDPSADRTDL